MPLKSQNYDGSVFVPVKRAESYGAIFALTRVTRRGPHGRAGMTTACWNGSIGRRAHFRRDRKVSSLTRALPRAGRSRRALIGTNEVDPG